MTINDYTEHDDDGVRLTRGVVRRQQYRLCGSNIIIVYEFRFRITY